MKAPEHRASPATPHYSASTVTDRFEEGDIITPGSTFDAVETTWRRE